MPAVHAILKTGLWFVPAYFAAAYLPLLTVGGPVGFPSCYPPLGILVATLLLTDRWAWPIWIALTVPMLWAAHLLSGLAVDPLRVIVVDSVAALTGASLVQYFGGRAFRLDSLRNLAVLVGLGGIVAATAGSFVAVVVFGPIPGSSILTSALVLIAALSVAIVTMAPAILLWDVSLIKRWFREGRSIEFCCLAVTVVAMPLVVFLLQNLPIIALAMVPLLWAAIRFGPLEAAVANLVLGLLTIVFRPSDLIMASNAGYSLSESSLYVQMYLILMAIGPSLAVAFAMLERERADAALEQGETRLRALLDNSPMVISVRDLRGRYLTVNQKFRDWYGDPLSEGRSKVVGDVFPADISAQVEGVTARVVTECRAIDDEFAVAFRSGEDHLVRVTHFPIVNAAGVVIAVGAIGSDVTEARRAEEQLRQAQKMEAIGQLTGGIAHDFNNLLAVVIGNLELVLEDVPPEAKSTGRTQTALNAAERGAALTQRLLAFSRKQALKPEVLDVSQVVEGMQAILVRAVGEQITFMTTAEPGLWSCEADKAQFEAALLNLVINARDAMPTGGTLSIEAGNVHLDEHYASTQVDLEAGDYVMIAVADTGEGMSAEVRERAFDPFFSTKSKGQGSGLGLAMVHGFVKQSGGHVSLYSELGHGTTVKIYLPRCQAATGVPEASQSGEAMHPLGQQELVLVVEDDNDVRALTEALLTEVGYRVIAASDGQSALDQLSRHADIDLLLTDVVLAGSMSGRDVADAAAKSHPQLAVLYMSGYTANVVVKQGRLDPDVELLQKPFHRADLARAVRKVLDRAG